MNRYKLITSRTPSGGFQEFSAPDDAAAVERSERLRYGARIVQLSQVTWVGGVEHNRRVV